jgi:hypothetical protein
MCSSPYPKRTCFFARWERYESWDINKTCTRSSSKCWNPRSFRGALPPPWSPTRLCQDPPTICCDSWFICCSKTKWKPWMNKKDDCF